MELDKYINIIELLTLGKNPHTELKLGEQDLFLNNEINRALRVAICGLKELKRKEEKYSKLPKNNGKLWIIDEEDKLIDEFNMGEKIDEIARNHKRTVGAIRSKLVHMGLVEVGEAIARSPFGPSKTLDYCEQNINYKNGESQ